MNRIRIRILAVALGAVLAAVTPMIATAQECGQCREAEVEDDWVHKFWDGGAHFQCSPNDCHGNWIEGFCSDFHDGGCPGAPEPEAIAQALQAVEASDVAALVALATEHPTYFRVADGSRALLVLSCQGGLTGRFDLGEKVHDKDRFTLVPPS